MWPFSEMSLSTASLVGTIANWGLLVSLLAGLFSTFVIVKTTDVKEEHWEAARRESAERVASLVVQGEQLRKDTAEANARALEATLALEKIKTPRSIPASEIPRLVASLSSFSGTKAAIYVLGDGPEPNGLAGVLSGLLKRSNWDSLSWNWVGGGAANGILVLCKDGAEPQAEAACDALVRALVSVDLDAGRQRWPGDWAQVGGMLNGPNPPNPTAAPIRIVIGTKPQ